MGTLKRKIALLEVENQLLSSDKVDLKSDDFLFDGIYIKSLFIPKDIVLTGKVHTKPCVCISLGDIGIFDEDKEIRLTGQHIFESKAGVKRLGRTFEDSLFITIHKTDLSSREEIEKDLFVDTYSDYENRLIQDDHASFMIEYQLDPEKVKTVVENTNDVLPIGGMVKESSIHGLGVFADKDYDGYIGMARIGEKRTHYGRYVNHSPLNNSKMVFLDNGDVELHGTVAEGQEITINYRDVAKIRGWGGL